MFTFLVNLVGYMLSSHVYYGDAKFSKAQLKDSNILLKIKKPVTINF